MSGHDQALSDYLDGRLTPAEATAFEARLSAEPALARRLRLACALKASLAAAARPMPPDLKAELKRRARARAAEPERSWVDALRAALGAVPWPAYGAGAAFAAAALALAIARLGGPPRRAAEAPRAGAPAQWEDAAASAALRDLWSDDAGGDDDEG